MNGPSERADPAAFTFRGAARGSDTGAAVRAPSLLGIVLLKGARCPRREVAVAGRGASAELSWRDELSGASGAGLRDAVGATGAARRAAERSDVGAGAGERLSSAATARGRMASSAKGPDSGRSRTGRADGSKPSEGGPGAGSAAGSSARASTTGAHPFEGSGVASGPDSKAPATPATPALSGDSDDGRTSKGTPAPAAPPTLRYRMGPQGGGWEQLESDRGLPPGVGPEAGRAAARPSASSGTPAPAGPGRSDAPKGRGDHPSTGTLPDLAAARSSVTSGPVTIPVRVSLPWPTFRVDAAATDSSEPGGTTGHRASSASRADRTPRADRTRSSGSRSSGGRVAWDATAVATASSIESQPTGAPGPWLRSTTRTLVEVAERITRAAEAERSPEEATAPRARRQPSPSAPPSAAPARADRTVVDLRNDDSVRALMDRVRKLERDDRFRRGEIR